MTMNLERRRNGKQRSAGFTLLEMVVVTAIFGSVLTVAYQILSDTLNVDRRINRGNQAERIGTAILEQIRRDLQGAVYQDLGERVFVAYDDGVEESAADVFHFITTAPVPEPLDDYGVPWTGEHASVGYVLQQSEENSNDDALTLFRRVKWFYADEPLDDGSYYPVYERVKALSIRYLDETGTWVEEWDSEARFGAIADLMATEEESEEGGTPSTPTPVNPLDPDALEDEIELPVVIPRAVELTLYIYLGDEKGLVVGPDGQPVVEEYYAVVPLLATEFLEIEPDPNDPDDDPDSGGETDGGDDGEGDDGGFLPGTGNQPGGSDAGGRTGRGAQPGTGNTGRTLGTGRSGG